MPTRGNVKKFRQYKSRFYFIVEQILAFTLRNNFFRKVKNKITKE